MSVNMTEEREEAPECEELMTPADWWGDSSLPMSPEQLEVLGGYAGNMWRASSGWTAALPQADGTLQLAVPCKIYWQVYGGLIAPSRPESSAAESMAFLAALDDLAQEGISEQWYVVARAMLEQWESVTARDRRRFSHVLGKFTSSATIKRRSVLPPAGRMVVQLLEVTYFIRHAKNGTE
jgi:hypothetical protein